MAHPATKTTESDFFMRQIADAVQERAPTEICSGVKTALEELAVEGASWIPSDFFVGSDTHYARKLLYQCPEKTYSIMLMVWQPGQGTAIHDHAGRWCVECVIRGEIEVISYDHTPDGDHHRFAETDRITAFTGDVGVLIPPNEYHLIRNATDKLAATVHVYEGEMLWCHRFEPADVPGTFTCERCTLSYDD